MECHAFGEDEEIAENIRYSLSLGLQEFQPSLVIHDGVAVLVGSGPTVKDCVEDIRQEKEQGRTIITINGGHDFLMGHGIVPDIFVTTDPRGMPQNFKFINERTIYLLSSRVHPKDFDLVLSKTKNVVIWHSDSRDKENELLEDKLRVGGGTTSGLRAMFLAYLMGFRKFHLYGFDSCITSDKRKRWDSGPMKDETATTDVIVGERKFLCNMAMALQANEFQEIFEYLYGIEVTSFGDGLITAILEARCKNAEERWGYESIHRRRPQTGNSRTSAGVFHTETGIKACCYSTVEDRSASDNTERAD